MASKENRLPVSDWMYHAPSRATQEAVGAPPPSQIPCLHGNEDLPPTDIPPKMLLKESDSAYIRLAKMGGREDLLRMRSPGPSSDEPVGYPRVEWYYQDDVRNTDQEKDPNTNYEFMLPDYMVHNENPKKSEPGYRPNRLPYAQDRTSVYEREGDNPNDKTIKIAEEKAAGYGVRQKKVPSSQAPIERTQMCKPPSPQIGLPTKQYKPVPSPKEENSDMGKLLSFGYVDDWRKDRDSWTDKQQKYAAAHSGMNKPDKLSTEYREQTSPTKSAPKPTQKTKPTNSAGTIKEHKGSEEDKPDFFKLSKYPRSQIQERSGQDFSQTNEG